MKVLCRDDGILFFHIFFLFFQVFVMFKAVLKIRAYLACSSNPFLFPLKYSWCRYRPFLPLPYDKCASLRQILVRTYIVISHAFMGGYCPPICVRRYLIPKS